MSYGALAPGPEGAPRAPPSGAYCVPSSCEGLEGGRVKGVPA
jgi:hypothetical protein